MSDAYLLQVIPSHHSQNSDVPGSPRRGITLQDQVGIDYCVDILRRHGISTHAEGDHSHSLWSNNNAHLDKLSSPYSH
jgi:hypothetical protein